MSIFSLSFRLKRLYPTIAMIRILTFSLFFFLCLSTSAQKIFVDSSASGLNTGLNWTDAYTSLQTAIDSSMSGDTICIAEGTYYPSEKPRGCTTCDSTRDVTFHIKDGLTLIGGFSAGGLDRNWKMNKTILSGDIGVKGDSTDNAYHVMIGGNLDEGIRVEGLFIQEGGSEWNRGYNC